MPGMFIVFIVLFLIFLLIMKIEPRTLFSGGTFALAAFALFSAIQTLLMKYPVKGSSNEVLSVIFHALGRLIQLVIAAGPLLLALLPVFMGIMLIKQEGFRFRNVASILFGTLAFLYVVVWPMMDDIQYNTVGIYVYLIVTIIVVYFIILKTVFTASSIVNQIHRKGDKGYGYILVLGTDLEDTKQDVLMRRKVDRGTELYRENPGSKMIFAGSDDFDGKTEGAAMAEYARELGVPDSDIIIEDVTKGAEENIKASYQLMEPKEGEKRPKFALVSGAHHVLRALILAKINRIKCKGYGAKVKIQYRMNAFVIEYVTYLRRTKKRHIIGLSLFAILMVTLLTVALNHFGGKLPQ